MYFATGPPSRSWDRDTRSNPTSRADAGCTKMGRMSFPNNHVIKVTDRRLSVDDPRLVQNNMGTETITLDLDAEWEGLGVIVNMSASGMDPVSMLWSGDPLVIPSQVMSKAGDVAVSVIGHGEDGALRAVTASSSALFRVVASGFAGEGDEPVPDAPDLLSQLIGAAGRANEAADRFDEASDAIEGIGEAVDRTQASEANAKRSEENAASSAASAQSSASNASTSEKAAKTSETNAAGFATSASGYATSAQSSATNASEYATSASQSKAAAKASETAASEYAQTASNARDAASQSADNAAASATAAQDAVDNFGLEAGTTTTGEPGTDAEVEIVKDGTKYKANFTIPRGDKGEPGQGGGSGIASVVTDDTLVGDGTSENPLKIFQGGIFYNPLPADQLDYDSIDESTIGKIYYANNGSKGAKPPANVEGVCFKFRASSVAVLEIVFSNDLDSSIYMRCNYRNNWQAWRTFAKDSTLSNYVPLSTYQALEARVQALESKPRYYRGWQDPAETGVTLHNGDLWLKTPHYLTDINPDNPTEGASTAEYYTYAQGAADNSPSVLIRTGQVVTDLLEYSDGAWWSLIWRVDSSLTPGKETTQSTAVASTLSETELLTRIEALEAEVKSLKGAE